MYHRLEKSVGGNEEPDPVVLVLKGPLGDVRGSD